MQATFKHYAMMTFEEGRQVLPVNVKPIHDTLVLQPDPETFKVEGSVPIELNVVEQSSAQSVRN